MKKILQLTTIITGLLLIGAGCALWNTTVENTNTPEGNTNATVENANTQGQGNTNETNEVDTNDWLTYTNEEHGFSFKYPQSMIADQSYILTSNLNTFNTYTLIQLSIQSKYSNPVFSISVAQSDLNTTIDQIMVPDVASSKKKSTTSLAGKEFEKIEITGPEGGTSVYLYQVDDKTILISVPDMSNYLQVVDTITFSE